MRWFDRLLFRQALPLIRIGRERPLQAADAAPMPDVLHPEQASKTFTTLNPATFWPFILGTFRATGAPARSIAWLIGVRLVVSLATPVLIKRLLEQLPSVAGAESIPVGILLLATALGLMGMTGAIVMQHFFANALQAFAIVVNGINRRVVDHALALRHSSRAGMNTGDLVNHLSSDTYAVAESTFFLPEFAWSLLITIAVMTLLTWYLGVAALAAVATLMVLSPLSVVVARRYRRLDHQLMELRDERVTLMSQILHGIRVVKYQAWEPSVLGEVADVRGREIHTRLRIVRTDALSTALFVSTTTIVAFVGFGTYVLLGGTLTAPLVFASLSLFAMLEDPFGMVSHLLANLQHARVAAGRLQAYFSAGTRAIDERETSAPLQPVGVAAVALSLRFPAAEQDALQNITLTVNPGESVAIVGAVGSGKSTLLRCLAGLHHVDDGSVVFTSEQNNQRPRGAYVPQEAFIMNATVEENITFGETTAADPSRLAAVLKACALRPDVQALPAGLRTEIGERGVNLSGGQKQRLSLARALWHQPGIVFLDDPLSAVDPDTEHQLVRDVLFGAWSGITRVVVTHRLAHLHLFDRIVVLDHGRVVGCGTFDEVRMVLPSEFEMAEDPPEPALNHPVMAAHDMVHETRETASRITVDEDRDTGAVRLGAYVQYVRAMMGTHPVWAPLILVGLVLSSVAITVLPMMQTSWMGYWIDQGQHQARSVIRDPLTAVAIYGALGTLVLTGWLLERLLWLHRSAAAGRSIHDHALAGVLAAPLRFFDSTPMGRVLNRFARDMEGVDDFLAWNWEQSFKSLSQTIGSLVLIVAVLPVIVVVFVPSLVLYYRLQRDYRSAAREAKRLESIARSPRYAHFKEMITGLDVIHGFAREEFFRSTYLRLLTAFQQQYWTSILLNRWFSVRVPIVSGAVSVATSIGLVVLAHHGTISTGLAGVVLTYALSFWWSLNWTVRAFSEVESRMTSVERLRSYGTLASEPRTTDTPILPDSTAWPTAGAIEFQQVSVRYADHLPLVLRDVSFTIPARAKVGIVGRTGSGKSTIFQVLFRCVEPASGRILIDGVSTSSIPLDRLRKNMAIIPQDPTLFIGTVRSNLDRFDECTDDEIWTALRRVQLDRHIRAMEGGLWARVTEGGANFSQGQRQLLCMARALLVDAKVIVLDEATASVDVATDALIQRTIRQEFADVTVLVIAHRLETVTDADLIIELSAGTVTRVTTR